MTAQATTLAGTRTTFSDETLDQLRQTFRGPVLGPGDEGYDAARVVQNAMFDRRPGLIVRATGTADVVEAVRLASERDLLVAVHAGGHSVAGHSTADGALMIDLSLMRGVWVDPGARTVHVQGGATWGDVDRETQLFGLAVPGGIVSTTGVAGLTLGGGIGWLHRKYGLASDNLRAVEIVTADGAVLRASAREHQDLFWALRGGGGSFGVVTAFEFEAHPVGPVVMDACAVYAAADAEDVFRAWADWTSTVTEEVTSRAVFWSMPAHPMLPPEVHGRDVLITEAVYAGPAEEGEQALRQVGRLGAPLADLSARLPYRVVQSKYDGFFPKGEHLSYWKSTYLSRLDAAAADLVVDRGTHRPHPLTMVHVPTMGGAMHRTAPGDTAFEHRTADYLLSVDGNWTDPADTEANVAWVRGAVAEAALLPSAGGTYLNFSGDDDPGSVGREAAFGDNLGRLAEVKKQVDPHNLFRLNTNIQPGA
jgi:FAD/FMN-containing dehydrogenase